MNQSGLALHEAICLYEKDHEAYTELVKNALREFNIEPLGPTWILTLTAEEILFSNEVMFRELDSFHCEQCLFCNWHKVDPPKLPTPEEYEAFSDQRKRYFKLWQESQARLKPEKPRKLFIHRGEHLWCFVCSSCKEPEKPKTTSVNAEQLKNEVLKLLGE